MTFVKGKSGNPKGMKPGTFSLLRIMRAELQKKPEGEKEDFATKGIRKYVQQFAEGKSDIVQDGIDRFDGKAPAALDITSQGEKIENPIVAAIVSALQ